MGHTSREPRGGITASCTRTLSNLYRLAMRSLGVLKMKALFPALVFTCCTCLSVQAATPEERGLQIAQNAEKANNGFTSETSSMTMELINSQGDKTTRKMASRVLEMSHDGDRSLITFEWPADVKGTRMLTWSHKTKTDDQWLYLPSLGRVKRISSRNKSGSFMGSEFAYEDLGSQETEKYTQYKYLGDDSVDGRKTWKLHRVPTERRSGYSKQIVWMDVEYQNALKIEFYDRKGELLKTMKLTGYKQYGTYWRASRIDVVNHQTRKKSVLTWSDRSLGTEVDETEFESESLSE